MYKVEIAIPDIHCKKCAFVVSLTLENLAGIENSFVNFEKRCAEIQHNPHIISIKKIVKALNYLGFHAYLSSVS